jgi:hypothetical protein
MLAEKEMKTNIQNSTLNSSFVTLSKLHDPHKSVCIYVFMIELPERKCIYHHFLSRCHRESCLQNHIPQEP